MAKCLKIIWQSGHPGQQSDQIGGFFKVLGDKYSFKTSPNLYWIFGYFENITFQVTLLRPLFCNFWKYMDYFLFQNLVTLCQEKVIKLCLCIVFAKKPQCPIFSGWKEHCMRRYNIYLFSTQNSVTRLGDLLDFGQLFKPLATITLPKSSTFLSNFC